MKEKMKIYNQSFRAARRAYKKTPEGKTSEHRYRNKKYATDGKNRRLVQRYGITIEDYNRILAEQKGLCAICGNVPTTRFHVDHDHATGKVRGLLCVACNMALGLFKDNPRLLERSIEYLKKNYVPGNYGS